MKTILRISLVIFVFLGLVSCTTGQIMQGLSVFDKLDESGLTDEQIATLSSLEQVDDYPLYTMHYYVPYETVSADEHWHYAEIPIFDNAWGCSLFSAFADSESMVFGRNFDWEYSPALLLYTYPSDGFSSVSMVDIKYLGFWHEEARGILELPLAGRIALLDAYLLPFDGVNEAGVIVGMAAVPPGNMPADPNKETVDSLLVIREILDHASDIDQAVSILESYNIDYGNGPALHYLIADKTGASVLVEFYQGEMYVVESQGDWLQATNFLVSATGDSPKGRCWRYDRIHNKLSESSGRLSAEEAMALLADVSQDSTQWSIVYDISRGNVHVSMGRDYEHIYELQLQHPARDK